MLKPTSSVLLIQSSHLPQKKLKIPVLQTSIFQKQNQNQKSQIIENINTMKIDFTHMYQQPANKLVNNQYTECQCGAVLTVEEEMQVRKMNEGKEEGKEGKEGGERKDGVEWYCRYCKKYNVSRQVHFMRNNSKILLQKNTQRGYLPPILLFLIDISGSMGESITKSHPDNLPIPQPSHPDNYLFTASKQIEQLLQQSIFRQKQSYKQKKQQNYQLKQQIQIYNKYNNNNKEGDGSGSGEKMVYGINYYSKIVFFMAVIENYLKKILNSGKDVVLNGDFRVGFVFFNQAVFVMKPHKHKTIPTFVSKNSGFKKQFPFDKNVVNFQDFDQIFQKGKKLDRFFADSKFKNHDFSKLMTEHLNTEGQTAFGPALALALGIASAHDIGSRIVIVSDAMPNIGLLSQQTLLNNQKIYNRISKLLQNHQLSIGLLTWLTDIKKSQNSTLKKFILSQKQRINQIVLDFSLRHNHVQILNTARKSLENLINRGSIGQIFSIKLLTSNIKIEPIKLKYDQLSFKYVKFIGLVKKNWVQFKIKKLNQEDYMFPLHTQIVIKYQDILTKQKYLYMSYVVQKIVNVSQNQQIENESNDKMTIGEIFEYFEESKKSNMKELDNLKKLFNFDKNNIVLESVASRNFQQISMNMSEKGGIGDFSLANNSLNSLAALENYKNQDLSDQDEVYL